MSLSISLRGESGFKASLKRRFCRQVSTMVMWDAAGELGHVAGLVGIGLLFLQFLDLDVVEVVVAQGGVVDFEAQALRAGGVYFVEGLGVGEFFEPELNLVLVDGREVGQDVVGVGFTTVDINDVCIHIPAILNQAIGHRVSRVRRKFKYFLTTERDRNDTEGDGDFNRGGRREHGLG